MARTRSSGGESLRTYPFTPALSDSDRSRAPPFDVKTTMAEPSSRFRSWTSEPTSRPAPRGSTITTSGESSRAAPSAAAGVAASVTTTESISRSSKARIPCRTTGWSSMIRQRSASRFIPAPAYSFEGRCNRFGSLPPWEAAKEPARRLEPHLGDLAGGAEGERDRVRRLRGRLGCGARGSRRRGRGLASARCRLLPGGRGLALHRGSGPRRRLRAGRGDRPLSTAALLAALPRARPRQVAEHAGLIALVGGHGGKNSAGPGATTFAGRLSTCIKAWPAAQTWGSVGSPVRSGPAVEVGSVKAGFSPQIESRDRVFRRMRIGLSGYADLATSGGHRGNCEARREFVDASYHSQLHSGCTSE